MQLAKEKAKDIRAKLFIDAREPRVSAGVTETTAKMQDDGADRLDRISRSRLVGTLKLADPKVGWNEDGGYGYW